LSAQLPHKWH